MKKLKVFEAFSGYGSQLMALKRIGIDCEAVAISEIDRIAILAYDALHGEGEATDCPDLDTMKSELLRCNVGLDVKTGKVRLPKNEDDLRKLYMAHVRSGNLGDISKIEPDSIPDHDLFTYSFPCQDISNIGQGKGFSEGEGTRSGLLWECRKVIEAKKPDYLLLENVKNIVSKKHMPNFTKWCEWLETQGYKNHWQVLNAKDYGIPQNRERCFMVSVRNGTPFEFPTRIPLQKKLRNMLEAYVEPKFYLKDGTRDYFISNSFKMERNGNGFKFEPHIGMNAGIAKCILTRPGQRMDDNYIVELDADTEHFTFNFTNPRILDFDNGKVKIKLNEQTMPLSNENLRIRKLTNIECFRLMGCTDEESGKMSSSGLNENELFKLAGNSIVINVLEEIFRNLFIHKKTNTENRDDFKLVQEN